MKTSKSSMMILPFGNFKQMFECVQVILGSSAVEQLVLFSHGFPVLSVVRSFQQVVWTSSSSLSFAISFLIAAAHIHKG